jgi:hypothetical protein
MVFMTHSFRGIAADHAQPLNIYQEMPMLAENSFERNMLLIAARISIRIMFHTR